MIFWALDFSYDEILMICTGLAALGWVLSEHRRDRRAEEVDRDHAERLARLEERLMAVSERVAAVEAAGGSDDDGGE